MSESRKVADEWLEFYVLVSGSGSDTAEGERQIKSDLRGGIYELRRNRRCQIRRIMGEGSSVSVLTLEKPLGLMLAPDTKGNIRVIDIEEGGRAAKLNAVSKLQGDSAVQRGDVLRAITTSTVQIDMARGSLTGTYIEVSSGNCDSDTVIISPSPFMHVWLRNLLTLQHTVPFYPSTDRDRTRRRYIWRTCFCRITGGIEIELEADPPRTPTVVVQRSR